MTFLEDHWVQLAATLLFFQVAWQLHSGKASWHDERPVTRQGNPRAYWFRVGVYAFAFVLVLVTGQMEWGWSWSSRDAERSSAGTSAPTEVAEAPATLQRRNALALHNAHKYADAIVVYDSLLAAADADADLHLNRGLAHWNLAHNDLALEDFRRVMALDGARIDAAKYVDQMLSAQQRWDEIIAMWDEFIRKNPGNATAYLERGGTKFHKGDLAAALADATKSCDLGNAAGCSQAARLKAR